MTSYKGDELCVKFYVHWLRTATSKHAAEDLLQLEFRALVLKTSVDHRSLFALFLLLLVGCSGSGA